MPIVRHFPAMVLPSRSVHALLLSRRSVHAFDSERTVPDEVVDAALGAAVFAPNHKHSQPWRFYVLGPETRRALIDLNAEVFRARSGDEVAEAKRRVWSGTPGYLVVTCTHSDDPLRYQEDRDACAAAAQNLLLALWSDGVGTKWTTGPVTRDSGFASLIGFDPEREAVIGLFFFGYPKDVPPPPARDAVSVITRTR